MSLEEIKKEGITFFSEAINKWYRLMELFYDILELRKSYLSSDEEKLLSKNVKEADAILAWFQENYLHHKKHSRFSAVRFFDGKEVKIDPIFDVIFRGANVYRICLLANEFEENLNMGIAHLRGHLSSIRNLKSLAKESEIEKVPLLRIRNVLSKYHLVASQLKRRRKNKTPYLIEDEYDVQDLLHAILRLDFGDIRREEWTPSYAGGASRIDLILKNEGVLIEVKKTGANIREKEIGDQLIVDIEHYKEYPGVSTLVCFIYDPDQWIENPEGLKDDLERQSTENINVEVIICPKAD